jgi:hypothetical protein
MAVQEGAKYLEKLYGGRGVLLGGVPGVPPAKVVILGGGVVGINAAKMAAGMGAKVTVLDLSLERLRYLSDVMPANVTLIYSNRHNILEQIRTADLVVGAVLIRGHRVPVVGVCFAGWQREYGAKQQHDLARKRMLALAERRSAAVLELDTKWPANRNKTGIRSPSEFESLLSRVDALLTTRLHGMRHFRASALISTGADISAVSKEMGHRTIAVTSDLYGHLFEKASKNMSRKAAKLVPRSRPASKQSRKISKKRKDA